MTYRSLFLFANFYQFSVSIAFFLFSENIVEPNQKTYYWYHRKFQRVPTVDNCYDDDAVCKYEATRQMKRDRYDSFFSLILFYSEPVFYLLFFFFFKYTYTGCSKVPLPPLTIEQLEIGKRNCGNVSVSKRTIF